GGVGVGVRAGVGGGVGRGGARADGDVADGASRGYRSLMWCHVLLYGVLAGVLVAALRGIEYRWLVIDHSLEIYGGLVAAVFATVGIWLGLKLTRKQIEIREVLVPAP